MAGKVVLFISLNNNYKIIQNNDRIILDNLKI